MSQKLGFWSVFGLVIASQLGTGILILPASLASFGIFSLVGWVISSCGAIVLALLFSILSARFPQTGGPHIYVKQAFGNDVAFFTGWTYWVISWISSVVVVVEAVGYFIRFVGIYNNNIFVCLFFQILLLIIIMLLNFKGIGTVGYYELVLAALKVIPLVIIPVMALLQFDSNNFVMDKKIATSPLSQTIGEVTLLTFWGFFGVEAATVQAGSVINPSKTIPRAMIIGTFCVAIVYIINTIGIIGLVPTKDLIHSTVPYVDAAQIIWGKKSALIISLIASIICIGTLNAWMLISGQIALGLAQDGLMPAFFAKKNKNGAPVWSLVICCLGILLLLIMTISEDLLQQIRKVIDFSVISILFVYLACSIAFLKLLFTKSDKFVPYEWLIAIGSIIFCLWIIYKTPLMNVIISISFILSGIPVYFLWYKRQFIKNA
ncbi:MAG: amino acid permease [Rickettsia endosymbiont of Labidopullus appendiculatus]|nr:amino acid permease [Rickettsia endosymbiont of Labidopullus appendiculatus]